MYYAHTHPHTHTEMTQRKTKSHCGCAGHAKFTNDDREMTHYFYLIYYFKGENSPLAGTPSILYRPDISPLSKCQIELKKIKKGEKKKDFFDFLHFASSLTLKREKKTV